MKNTCSICGRKAAYAVIDKFGFMEPGTLCPSHYISWQSNAALRECIFHVLSGGDKLLNNYMRERGIRSRRSEEDFKIEELPDTTGRTMREIKIDAIVSAYERNNHHVQKTCSELQISKATFYREFHKNNFMMVKTLEQKKKGKNR